MTGLEALWLPVLLSSVIVFVVSSVIHTALPWHRNDYRRLPDQDRTMDALRPLGIPPGDYMVPRPSSRQEMQTPEFAEKVKKGPVMVLTVMPGAMSMVKNLVSWFLYLIVVSFVAGLVAGSALPPGAGYRSVFRFVALTAFAGYSLGLWQMSIWYRRSWITTIKATVDGLLYAALTAGTFGWLWPR